MDTYSCSVCHGPSDCARYVSLCKGCKHGYNIIALAAEFLPYYEITSPGVPVIEHKRGCPGVGVVCRTYPSFEWGKTPKKETMTKKEITLRGTHRIDMKALLGETPGMRDYIIGDYLKVPRSKTTVGHVKKAFSLRGLAKKVLPSDPIAALIYLQKLNSPAKVGKKADVGALRRGFFDSANLFKDVCRAVGPIIASFVATTTSEEIRLPWENRGLANVPDTVPLIASAVKVLKETPIVLLKSELNHNGVSRDSMVEFLGKHHFEDTVHAFTRGKDPADCAEYVKIAQEMVHFSKTVGDIEGRRKYFDTTYGTRYQGVGGKKYIKGTRFMGVTGLERSHAEGLGDLKGMWDC